MIKIFKNDFIIKQFISYIYIISSYENTELLPSLHALAPILGS